MKQIFGALLAAAVLGLGATARAEETPDHRMVIYGDGLAEGWSNWSWAQVRLGVHASDDERPILVEAAPWSALYLQREGVDTHGYAALTFWVNGGESGGQTLSVMALINGQPAAEGAYFRVSPQAGAWQRVEVPLSAIGAADRTVDGFWIQNGSGEPAPRFFVNYIALE